MGRKNHTFTWLRLRMALLTRDAAPDFFRYPPGAVEPVNFGLGHIGAHPGPARIRVQIYAGALARAAGFSLVAGSLSGATGTCFTSGELRLKPVRSAVDRNLLPGRSGGGLAVMTAGRGIRKILSGRHVGLKNPRSTQKQFSPDLASREDLRVREKTKEKKK
jgi:hypothetical protein